MLAYALPALAGRGYTKIASEKFEHIHDLMATILTVGLTRLYKRGLHRDYITISDNLTTMRGQLNIAETIRNKILLRHKLACNFDDFSDNNPSNQILKTTLRLLLTSNKLSSNHRNDIKRLLHPLEHINTITPTSINWSGVIQQHHRPNSEYAMLLTICRFILNGLLHTTSDGKHIANDLFSEEQLSSIYQKFVLAYFRHHYPHLHPHAPYIEWDSPLSATSEYLPGMHTDIVLSTKNQTLIIDTKFYSKILSTHYNKDLLHSGNLYQIITYVLNMAKYAPNVSGMLLYAKTDTNCPPPHELTILNHKFTINVLDLNQDFSHIKNQLNKIADTFFTN